MSTSMVMAFVAAGSTHGGAAIGWETITVGGGAAVSAILSEVRSSKEYQDVGFDADISLTAVLRESDWIASYASAGTSYINKVATARGLTFRVRDVDIGRGFVTLKLEDTGKV